MEILYILIPLGLILLACAIWAFIWAVNKNQFDNLESPAQDIIFDDKFTHQNIKRENGSASNSSQTHND